MNILNEEIEHGTFGKGKVIGQEAERLSVKFSEQYGTKQFVYPDAFEKYLKLGNPNIEMAVLKELDVKQSQIESERIRKLQEYEASKELERLALTAQKRKSSHKSGASKLKKNNIDVAEKPEVDKQ